MTNPYQPPQTNLPPGGHPNRLSSGPGVCPSCQSDDYNEVKFTWWGGMLGPRMFNHVKCKGCGSTFNSKSGKSNNSAIAIYSVVGLVIALGALIMFNTM